jgi:predicted RNA-binding Zn-ribbon protein involved in translation (DUF1610 family)
MIKCPICLNEVKLRDKDKISFLYKCTSCVGEWALSIKDYATEKEKQKAIMETERIKKVFKEQKKFRGQQEKQFECPICGHVCTAMQMSSDFIKVKDEAGNKEEIIVNYICPKCGECHGSIFEWNQI